MRLPDHLVEEFDDWLHAFFLQRCGLVDDEVASTPPPAESSKRHRGLERLRQQKNECQKAFKVLKKAGLYQSRAGRSVKKLWLKLVKLHNKLRCKVANQKSQWRKGLGQRKFKQDPHKYAQNLFKGESLNGSPTCTKEEAELYFKKLYHDEHRPKTFHRWKEWNDHLLRNSHFLMSRPTSTKCNGTPDQSVTVRTLV